MFHIRYLIPLAVLLALAAPAGAGVIIPDISVSQDGKHFISLPVVSSDMSVHRYFRPDGTPAPRFGTSGNTDELALYFDTTDQNLCVLVVSGSPHQNSGTSTFKITRLGGSSTISLHEHTRNVALNDSQGTASFTLNSTHGVSGLSLGNLGSGPLTIQFQLQSPQADTQLRLAAGAGHRNQHVEFMSLNPDPPLVIESYPPAPHRYHFISAGTPGDSPPVPEPASLSLLAVAAALLSRPCRRR